MEETKNKPVKKFVVAPVSASVWEQTNEKDGRTFTTNSVTVQRTYVDKENNYQNTQNFRIQDLPKVRLVIEKAYDYLTTTLVEEPTVKE